MLPVTTQDRRYCNDNFNSLIVQVWLSNLGCICIHQSVVGTCYCSVFQSVLRTFHTISWCRNPLSVLSEVEPSGFDAANYMHSLEWLHKELVQQCRFSEARDVIASLRFKHRQQSRQRKQPTVTTMFPRCNAF